jgi:hypothetical protein
MQLMVSNEAAAEHTQAEASRVVDELASWLVANLTNPGQAFDVQKLLLDALVDSDDSATPVEHAAFQLYLAAARLAFTEDERDPDNEPDPDAGYRLLKNGDHLGALTLADRLQEVLAVTEPDDWNYGNLLHHNHIIRGKVFLAQDEIDAASAELLKAGGTTGSPQLDSFGPDLSLAWALLAVGRDADFVRYMRAISAFWTPANMGPATEPTSCSPTVSVATDLC